MQKAATEPLLAVDRAARRVFRPWRRSAPMQVLRWFGQAGDQLQLRTLIGGLFALGLVRGEHRLLYAAARMLVAHELATVAKRAVKDRVDRRRPRNAAKGKAVRPRKGRSKAKACNSFPSGHSAGAMAVACAFAAAYPEHRRAALTAAGAVSLAQVPTAAHYPSDVAAGMAIGAATDGAIGLAARALIAAARLLTGSARETAAGPRDTDLV